MDTKQFAKVSTLLPLDAQKTEICFIEYMVKLNPKLIMFKKLNVQSLDRISIISTIQYFLRYVEDKKVLSGFHKHSISVLIDIILWNQLLTEELLLFPIM